MKWLPVKKVPRFRVAIFRIYLLHNFFPTYAFFSHYVITIVGKNLGAFSVLVGARGISVNDPVAISKLKV